MSHRRFYRSRSALIGGVCAGIADFFNVDPVIVRIIVVALTLATGGVLGFAYLALWIMLPKAPAVSRPFDVEPAAVHSETYGRIDWTANGFQCGSPDARRGDSADASGNAHQCAGHMPPVPPPGAARNQGTDASWRPASMDEPTSVGETGPSASSLPTDRTPPSQPSHEERPLAVKTALWVGSLLLFFSALAVLANLIEGMAWWRFWPLSFMIAGIVCMVVPSESGGRVYRFVGGLVLFFSGTTLLAMSVDIVSWSSIGVMLASLWPLLLAGVVSFALGKALGLPWWTLAGGLCFVAFCIVGLGLFSLPGQTDAFVLTAPFGWQHEFAVR